MRTRTNKVIEISEKDFVAIIDGRPYHSNSWFDLEDFFFTHDYVKELNEIISSQFDLFSVFTHHSEEAPELWANTRGEIVPKIWDLYTNIITDKAEYVILANKEKGE